MRYGAKKPEAGKLDEPAKYPAKRPAKSWAGLPLSSLKLPIKVHVDLETFDSTYQQI
jgi:hypothetical protein